MSNARMRSVTNYFIINLSLADIINATFNVIPNFTYMLTGNWPFGEKYFTNMLIFKSFKNIEINPINFSNYLAKCFRLMTLGLTQSYTTF